MPKIGPHSSAVALAKLDGRTKEARRLKEIRTELCEHLGGTPSSTQTILIDRVAILLLRLEIMDAKALDGTPMTDHDQRAYLAWANALSRMLRHLGLKGQAGKPPTLADVLKATKGT
ncbi:hypothetical protein [Acidocella aminolytica]|uniref:Uncharacterized protein n=1 Tax=Acidocella aminolytica 101 = DSM 11237 TaxID=1120923 RepID=A0A0D6PL26_9PROT|nr:hypothetical protein [Acidocella aminolytica]GAN81464.1 hypothetical protein Aam_096_023 [Acidocella aminolytica 101 = DSM 11237]GBQ35041.1 hypothetical protein AA11237_0885 [Acidocella aminolytica 101 = DSM 11237]SHF02174.1 hypothetical protein SAMN02746095_01876 [Acidocella aminolytica 101 = DSM 11237]